MIKNKSSLFLWVLAFLPLMITIMVYSKLPNQIPMHWNIQGEIDVWYPKFPGAFMLPGVVILMHALLTYLPRLDPKKDNYVKFAKPYQTIQLFLVTLFLILQIFIIFVSVGVDWIKVDFLVKSLIALMMVVFGNVMPKFKHNYFVGVKTPWTLANEDIWHKTHRHAGYVWFFSGCALFVLSWISGTLSAILFFSVVLISAFEPIVYSYLVFKHKKQIIDETERTS